MRKNVKKLISPRVLCTSITNCVLCWFDRFTAYYNCMRKNVTKLISPWVLCTSITNRVFSMIWPFTAYYNCLSKNVTKLISREFCAQVSQIVFVVDLTVLRLTTVWTKIRNKTLISASSVCKCINKMCVKTHLTVLRLITTVWAKSSQNSYLRWVLCTSITKRVFSLFDLRLSLTVWAKC